MSAAGSSTDGAAAPTQDLRANIAALKEQAKELKTSKIQVNKALRNAEKKRARLKRKARELTDADLLQVIKLRHDEQTLKDEAAGRVRAEDPAAARATAGRVSAESPAAARATAGRVSAEDPAAARATAGSNTPATAATAAAPTAATAATASVRPEATDHGGGDEDLTE